MLVGSYLADNGACRGCCELSCELPAVETSLLPLWPGRSLPTSWCAVFGRPVRRERPAARRCVRAISSSVCGGCPRARFVRGQWTSVLTLRKPFTKDVQRVGGGRGPRGGGGTPRRCRS